MNYEQIKDKYKQYIVFKKVGIFYEVYGTDAYLFNYLFDYQIIPFKDTVKVGFPIYGLTKITNVLDSKKINYLVYEKEIVYLKKFTNNQYFQYSKVDILERRKE